MRRSTRPAARCCSSTAFDRFAARRPAFQALRDDMRRFLQLSRRGFFADGAREPGELAWLIAFGRRCRDAERFS